MGGECRKAGMALRKLWQRRQRRRGRGGAGIGERRAREKDALKHSSTPALPAKRQPRSQSGIRTGNAPFDQRRRLPLDGPFVGFG